MNSKEKYMYSPPPPPSESEVMKNWKGDVSNPVASVVCMTYQHNDYVRETLNGLLMQETNFPFEIIIRDDASTDGTVDIIKEYYNKYPNIIKLYLEEENKYSKGIIPYRVSTEKAIGKYVAICEGDDFWVDKNKLSKQVGFLEENDEFAIVYTDAMSIDENKNILSKSLLGKNAKDYTPDELINTGIIPNLTRCYRNVLNPLPSEFDQTGNSDTFILTLLGHHGGAKYLGDIEKCVYRRHSGGIWAGISTFKRNQMIANAFAWIAIYYKKIGKDALAERFSYNALLHFTKPLFLNKKSIIKFYFYNSGGRIYTLLKKIYSKL